MVPKSKHLMNCNLMYCSVSSLPRKVIMVEKKGKAFSFRHNFLEVEKSYLPQFSYVPDLYRGFTSVKTVEDFRIRKWVSTIILINFLDSRKDTKLWKTHISKVSKVTGPSTLSSLMDWTKTKDGHWVKPRDYVRGPSPHETEGWNSDSQISSDDRDSVGPERRPKLRPLCYFSGDIS